MAPSLLRTSLGVMTVLVLLAGALPATAQLNQPNSLVLEALDEHTTVDPRHVAYHHLEFRLTNIGSASLAPEVTLDPDPADWAEVDEVHIDADDVLAQGDSMTVYVTLVLAPAGGAKAEVLRSSMLLVDDGSGRTTSAAFDVRFKTSGPSFVQISGTVKDSRTGAPVEGALVQWFLASGRGPDVNTRTTRGDGAYTALAAADTSGLLVARAPGYRTYVDPAASFVGSGTAGTTAKASRAITLVPHDWAGEYLLDWSVDAGFPLYSGAATADLDYIAVGGGEALAAGYGNDPDPAFDGSMLVGMYGRDGEERWNHVSPLGDLGQGGGFWAVDVTADGFSIATGTSGGAVSLTDATGTRWTKQHVDPVEALSFSPDGTLLAVPGPDSDDGRSLLVYSIPDGSVAWSVAAKDLEGDPAAFAWKGDSSALIVAAGDLYRYARDGARTWTRTIGGGEATALAATADLSRIAAAGSSARLFLYDAEGDLVATRALDYASPAWMALGAGGSRIAIGSERLVALHRGDASAPIWTHYVGDSTAGAISSDGSYVLAATRGSVAASASALPNGLLLFDSAGHPVWDAPWGTLATYWGDDEYAQARFVAMSDDLGTIVTASTDNRLRAYTGSIREVVPTEPSVPTTPTTPTAPSDPTDPAPADPGDGEGATDDGADGDAAGKKQKRGLPAPGLVPVLAAIGLLAAARRRR